MSNGGPSFNFAGPVTGKNLNFGHVEGGMHNVEAAPAFDAEAFFKALREELAKAAPAEAPAPDEAVQAVQAVASQEAPPEAAPSALSKLGGLLKAYGPKACQMAYAAVKTLAKEAMPPIVGKVLETLEQSAQG